MSAATRVAAWIVLIGMGSGGVAAPRALAVVAVALAAPFAFFAFVGTVVSIWRGPPIVEFAPEEGVRCGEEASEPVRAYAQLRGTIGGAGHVHPVRLAFPAVSWAAALVAGVRGISPALEAATPSPVTLAVAAAIGAWFFPSRPYWYREVMGGGAVVTPPEALAALAARERTEDAPSIAAMHEVGRAAPILRERGPESGAPRAAPEGGAGSRPDRRERLADEVASAMRAADGVRGAAGRPTQRSPRYTFDGSLIVERDGGELEVAAVNVSDGGLAVRWPGELPVVGDDVVVKLEDGLFTRGVDAIVCWRAGPASDTVGLKVRAEGRAARLWRDLVQAASRSSARTA